MSLLANEDRSVYWDDAASHLMLLDQRKLPLTVAKVSCKTVEDVAKSISTMVVRGAPAIGAAGGFGMAIAAQHNQNLEKAKAILDAARPTAVNLTWATQRLLEKAQMPDCGTFEAILKEAKALAEQDVLINLQMAKHGAEVVPENANILHHCNTGALATVDIGTAIGVIYECHAQKKNIHVWVDETRPRLQGARLSAWELMRAGVPMHLIADNASGMLMRDGKVDVVLFGADRVAANGDTANKIGSYNISVLAKENGIPVYAVVPTSTIDLTCESGASIPIEERGAEEVACFYDTRVAPEGVQVFNPAFDVTPFKYLTGIITEQGICYPPFRKSLKRVKERAEEEIRRNK